MDRLLVLWNEVPPTVQVPIVAVGVLGLSYLAYLLMQLAFPKVAAIARTTAKEAWAQPLFWVELALGAVLLLFFAWIPYYTFGEDIKMLKESGLTLIMLLSIGLAVWNASVSIADELEGRTALTLMSKPIGRRQFVFGKFLGVLAPAFSMFVVLGTIFLCMVSYKVVYDARENSLQPPKMEECRAEVVKTVPGLVLAFFETIVLASISIAIATRLPMLANLSVCFAIYVLGHLTPLLVQSSLGKLRLVEFVGRFLATVLPVLDYFKSDAAYSADQAIPLEYLGYAFLYATLYSTIAMLLALVLFEDRDLA